MKNTPKNPKFPLTGNGHGKLCKTQHPHTWGLFKINFLDELDHYEHLKKIPSKKDETGYDHRHQIS